jgi:hypothetical protein
MYLCINSHQLKKLLSGLTGGPAHLARGLLGRHGPHKPYPGWAWAYKVARGPARHGTTRQHGRANAGRA